MFSVLGHSQIDTSDVEEFSHPPLEEFYSVKPLTSLFYITKCYANMKNGETQLYDHLVVKGYHKATTNLNVNADIHKQINEYRKKLRLPLISNESIMSERIVSNHEASILQVLNEIGRKPIVMWLNVENTECKCANSIFENIFEYNDIVNVIKDPKTTFFDVAYYQISKSGKWLSSYTVITYETKYSEHPMYFLIEHDAKKN